MYEVVIEHMQIMYITPIESTLLSSALRVLSLTSLGKPISRVLFLFSGYLIYVDGSRGVLLHSISTWFCGLMR